MPLSRQPKSNRVVRPAADLIARARDPRTPGNSEQARKKMPTAANKIRESLDATVLERKPPVAEGRAWVQPRMAPASQPMAQTSAIQPPLVYSHERLMNAREVAARLGVSERWVRDHTSRRNPRIRAVKLGSLIRYKRADVEIFMESLDTQRTSRPIQFGV